MLSIGHSSLLLGLSYSIENLVGPSFIYVYNLVIGINLLIRLFLFLSCIDVVCIFYGLLCDYPEFSICEKAKVLNSIFHC